MNDIAKPSVELLRDSLRDTYLLPDPCDVVMPAGSEHWPADFRASLTESLTPAGVLIPVLKRPEGLAVLLTQRSAALKHHAGQVSFPGGRMEEADENVAATALRETHEEVGILPAEVTILGYLDAMPTVTGYAITPVVGAVSESASVVPDHGEVEYAFEVPLEYLLDRRNAHPAERNIRGRKIPIVEFRYEGHRIWGATAHILLELRRKIEININ